jgi:hypothetical protein
VSEELKVMIEPTDTIAKWLVYIMHAAKLTQEADLSGNGEEVSGHACTPASQASQSF